MSRGFVKEEDQEEAPFIPPRAALPKGVINYVTPKGLRLLELEQRELEKELLNLHIEDDKERRHARAVLNGKLDLLSQRISSARVINPKDQPQDEVRFGAKVKLLNLKNNVRQEFQIVGVDQADVKKQMIAFIAPLARAVNGKRKGDKTELRLGNEIRALMVLEILY